MDQPLVTEFVNLGAASRRRRDVWVALLVLIAVTVLGCGRAILPHVHLCAALLVVTLIACIMSVRLLPRIGNDAFDPGFLFVMFVLVTILPITLGLTFGVNLLGTRRALAQLDYLLMMKTVVMHIVALAVTTATYVVLSQRERPHPFADSGFVHGLLSHKIWVLISIFMLAVMIGLRLSMGAFYTRQTGDSADIANALVAGHGLLERQVIVNGTKLADIATIFACGVLVARARTLLSARAILLMVTALMVFYSFYLFASRGAAYILLMAGAYADRVRWKGQLFSRRLFWLLFIGGWLGVHAMNIVEAIFLSGGYLSARWAFHLFNALEPQVIVNTYVVMDWVDSLEVPIRHGATYLRALETLVPSQLLGQSRQTLTNWFAWTYDPIGTSRGVGYGFSMIAEGYLNGRVPGVVVHSVLVGLFLYGLRRIRNSIRLGWLGPVLYASCITLTYKVYRTELASAIKAVEKNAISIIILVGIAMVLIRIGTRKPQEPSLAEGLLLPPEGAST